MSAKQKLALRSQQWSCSDLSRGAQQLKRVKREVPEAHEDDTELADQIKACIVPRERHPCKNS